MKSYILLAFILISSSLFSQRETDNWVFGTKTGLNFRTLRATTLEDTQMISKNGCASISDSNGNLLFYTNGMLIFNKNHLTMDNGFISGNSTYSQTSIIVPKPNSSNLYYVFTNANFSTSPIGGNTGGGLYYCLIDMNLNGGLGKVISKNNLLVANTSEKITAVHHYNGNSIWIITSAKTENSDYYDFFFSIKIDETGIDPIFVKSPTKREFGIKIKAKKGYLKASPNGKKIASADYNNGLTIYDFDNATGKLSNEQWLFYVIAPGAAPLQYGIAFSQDSKFLYSDGNIETTSYLQQFDLSNAPYGREIISESERLPGALQLAKNGKIYHTYPQLNDNRDTIGNTMLSIIHKPKLLGTDCDYETDAETLTTGSTYFGLPNFIQSYFRTRILTKHACVDNFTLFEVDSYANISAAVWDFGDGTSSTEITPFKKYLVAGHFNVVATITINNRQITVNKEIRVYPSPSINNNQHLIQCDVDNNGIDFFDLTDIKDKLTAPKPESSLVFYETRVDAENDTNQIQNPSQYQNTSNPQELFVRVINEKGCFTIANFFIESIFVQLGNIPEMFTCENSDNKNEDLKGLFDLNQKRIEIRNQYQIVNSTSLKFYPTLINAQTTNNELLDDFISPSTTIWVRAETTLGCGGIEPINLTVNNPISSNINNEYIICIKPNLHPPLILDGNISNDRFEWKNANNIIVSNNRLFSPTYTGNFSLTAYKSENGIECSRTISFLVKLPTTPSFSMVEIKTETPYNTINISINGNSSYEFSLDGVHFEGNDSNYSFYNVNPGVFTLYVRDSNTCEPSISRDISIIGFPKFMTSNEDGINDRWIVHGATPEFFKSINIDIFNRFGRRLYKIDFKNYQYGWDGRFNGKKLPPDEYWYHAVLIDKNDKTIDKFGNFSLIR